MMEPGYTPGFNIAGWKMGAPDWVDVFPIENGYIIPASYVSLPEGNRWIVKNSGLQF